MIEDEWAAVDVGGQVEIAADEVGDAFVAVKLDDEAAERRNVAVAVRRGVIRTAEARGLPWVEPCEEARVARRPTSPSTIRITRARPAPRAMRMPISLRRRTTL